MPRLDGKVMFITGAGTGIGRATALLCAREGARVAIAEIDTAAGEETGRVWLERLTSHYRRAAWLNPTPRNSWQHVRSIGMTSELMEGRMYPLTVNGIDAMARELSH